LLHSKNRRCSSLLPLNEQRPQQELSLIGSDVRTQPYNTSTPAEFSNFDLLDTPQNPSLSSPLGTFDFPSGLQLDYSLANRLYKSLSKCGSIYVLFLDTKTNTFKTIPLYCDNRCCLNPKCKSHREYKFKKEHDFQIRAMHQLIRKPKGWIFTYARLPYPINRKLAQFLTNKLYFLLNSSKHPKYGSKTPFSVHLEFKLYPNYYYLHFHACSGFISNLRLIRRFWGKQIKYEPARQIHNLEAYLSKYASKTPNFPSLNTFFYYATAVYKLQMHRFSSPNLISKSQSKLLLIEFQNSSQEFPFFIECCHFLSAYLKNQGNGG
jgi:hypothetical protein